MNLVSAPVSAEEGSLCKAVPQGVDLWVHVVGSRRLLAVCKGTKEVARFDVRLGSKGMGKQRKGDGKTPTGSYKITWVASRFFEKDDEAKRHFQIADGRGYCRIVKGGAAVFDPKRGLKGEELWTDMFGGKDAIVMGLDYPNAADRAAGRSGGCIEIHASLPRYLTTFGCIALLPADMKRLATLVDVGTPVELRK